MLECSVNHFYKLRNNFVRQERLQGLQQYFRGYARCNKHTGIVPVEGLAASNGAALKHERPLDSIVPSP